MGARNRVGIGLSYQPARAGGIVSLESLLGLLKSLKIPSQHFMKLMTGKMTLQKEI